MIVATSVGSVSLPVSAILSSLLSHLGLRDAASIEPAAEAILWSVRLPRVVLAALVGGGLGLVGAALQSLFRNPMADAGLLGVGPGAALGAVLAVNLGWAQQFFALPLAAFAGAMLAGLRGHRVSARGGAP